VARTSNLPAPFKGIDQRTPIAALQNPFCEDILNFNVSQAGLELRNGDSVFNQISTSFDVALSIAPFDETKLLLASWDGFTNKINIRNVETEAVLYSSTPTSVNYSEFYHSVFNKYLYFFTADATFAPGYYYDGTTVGAIGYTGSGFLPVGGAAFRNRHYIIQSGEAAYWYSGISSVSGALTKIDLSGIVKSVTELAIIAPIAISDNIATAQILAFVMFSGEVLFYAGAYPDSADWQLVGTAETGQALFNNSGLSYGGDYLAFTNTGVVSLRSLFLNRGDPVAQLPMGAAVQESWRILAAAVLDSIASGDLSIQVSGVWDKKNSRVVIGFPKYIDASGDVQLGTFFFIYDTLLQSWLLHRSFGVADPTVSAHLVEMTYYKNKVLFIQSNFAPLLVYEKEGASGFTDRNYDDDDEVAYDYSMLSAPIPFPKTAVYEASFIEPILESDLYAETNWNLVADFGRQTSGNQKTDAATTSVAKPGVNVGMQNITYVQVKMSGTTAASKSVGLKLYSYNIMYNSGEEGSR